MRNWNSPNSSICFSCSSFWVYLWGIETAEKSSQKSRIFIVLSLPMRNWNSWDPIKSISSYSSVLSLPMRNWNEYVVHLTHHSSSSFWVYLWGIETEVWEKCLEASEGFESTYEELKHLLSHFITIRIHFVLSLPMRNWNSQDQLIQQLPFLVFWVYLWGIETLHCDRLSSKLLRFESTYEELKPNFENRMINLPYGVLSLPMRNWN